MKQVGGSRVEECQEGLLVSHGFTGRAKLPKKCWHVTKKTRQPFFRSMLVIALKHDTVVPPTPVQTTDDLLLNDSRDSAEGKGIEGIAVCRSLPCGCFVASIDRSCR